MTVPIFDSSKLASDREPRWYSPGVELPASPERFAFRVSLLQIDGPPSGHHFTDCCCYSTSFGRVAYCCRCYASIVLI